MISTARPSPKFEIGQLVKHRRYGYRGIVLHLDPFCKAPESWYYANQTQPDREQPWYHVLVDGDQRVTYAAQSSLDADDSNAAIDNPLIQVFFEELADGGYRRNDRSWNGNW